MITKKTINEIKEEAKKYFVGANGCHDWTHVKRVHELAIHIGKKEKADLKVLEVASYLHDIGRKKEMKNKGSFCHAEKGACLAREILNKYNIKKEVVDNVIHCIITHRFRNSHKPQTIEARVLYDADKLDSIGAVGIGRAFLFAGNVGSKRMYSGNEKKIARLGKDYSYTKEDSALLEYEIKLKKIKNKLLTKEGGRMGRERSEFMRKYFERFLEEIKGNK